MAGSVNIRERRWFPRKTANVNQDVQVPFSCRVEDRRMHLNVPSYARVRVKMNWGWQTLHSGVNWAESGAMPDRNDIGITLPLDAEVRVEAQGKSWKLNIGSTLGPEQKEPFFRRIRNSRFFGYSVLFHVGLFAGLLILIRMPHSKDSKSSQSSAQAITLADLTIGPDGRPISRPFSGISYAQYLKRLLGSGKPGDPMDAALKSLSGLDFGAGASVAKAAATGQTPLQAQLAQGSAAGAQKGLSDQIAANKFANAQAPAKTSSGRRLSEEEQSKVRQIFRGFQESFKRVYSQALASDPNLAVTVSFEAKVLDNGYLTLSQFNARGNYLPDALAQLKSGMGSIVQTAFVGKELNGTVIRGENVFVR